MLSWLQSFRFFPAVSPAKLVVHYNCDLTTGVNTDNKTLKNYAKDGNVFDVIYTTPNFISTDTNFADSANKGSFNCNNTDFGGSTTNYDFSARAAVTCCFWIKVLSLSPRGFFPLGLITTNGSWWFLPQFEYNATTSILVYVFIYLSNTSFFFQNLPSNINGLNTWYHFAVVMENGKRAKLYVNGVLTQAESNNVLNFSAFTSTSGIQISGKPSGTHNRLICRMNDIRIYNDALSTQQIQQIYNWDGNGTLIV